MKALIPRSVRQMQKCMNESRCQISTQEVVFLVLGLAMVYSPNHLSNRLALRSKLLVPVRKINCRQIVFQDATCGHRKDHPDFSKADNIAVGQRNLLKHFL